MTTRYTPTEIRQAFTAASYVLTSSASYVGTQRVNVTCALCGQERRLSAAELLSGKRGPCGHKRVGSTPRRRRPVHPEELVRWQARPLEPEPDDVVTPWRLECAVCGQHLRRTINHMRVLDRLCAHKETYEDRSARNTVLMTNHSYWPVGPYPGRASLGWACVCMVCGQVRRPSVDNVKRRGGCRHVGATHGAGALGAELGTDLGGVEHAWLRLRLVWAPPGAPDHFVVCVSMRNGPWAPVTLTTDLEYARAAYEDSVARFDGWMRHTPG
ncbi:hypothetical protein ACIBBE_23800 [Streptomyces sp. NPDC051644]|uniref:hypothetical protein n=1 Tax=Streptomyces sp. NPDC051644 TaxID=3365666 RepID=UPI0037BC4E20